MLNLPWDLWLNPPPLPDGVTLETEFDAATSRLRMVVVNSSSNTVAPGKVGVSADLEAPATGNWAWLHGRYMQMDALVRNFGEPMPEGYDGHFARKSDETSAYVSREIGTLSVLSQQPPVLQSGSLRMDRHFFDIEYRLDADETHITGLSL